LAHWALSAVRLWGRPTGRNRETRKRRMNCRESDTMWMAVQPVAGFELANCKEWRRQEWE